MKPDRLLAIQVFDSKYNALSSMKIRLKLNLGWIKYIRTLLGMTSKQLAKRLNLNPATISRVEVNEIEGSITLKRMKRIADALECDFVYGLIPRKKIGTAIDEAANKKAMDILKESMSMMELEDQSVKSKTEIKRQLKELVEKIKNDKYLWE